MSCTRARFSVEAVVERVVHHGGHRAVEGLLRGGEHRIHLRPVRDIGRDSDRARAQLRDEFTSGRRAPPVIDHHPGAFTDESLGERGSQAATGARDEHYLVLNVDGGLLLGGSPARGALRLPS